MRRVGDLQPRMDANAHTNRKTFLVSIRGSVNPSFASIRVHSWFGKSLSRLFVSIRGSVNPSRVYSCPFVVR
jgi:hypothetical protein